MSKKKAFSGNTMTLKDFHGGSIPIDLPLPSAPGVSADWYGDDRPNSWGGPIARPDHRARPNSSPATGHFDDKTPFLNHPVHIGHNFDEDERKPLDGGSAPSRTVSDESFRVPPSKVELKPEPVLAGRALGVSSGPQVVSPYSNRVNKGAHVEVNVQNFGGNVGYNVCGSRSNAWAARKELMVGANEPMQSAWLGGSTVSKLAHASALEKVSSGRWQTNHAVHYRNNVEVVEHLETKKGMASRGYDEYVDKRVDVMGGREYSDVMLARQVERSLGIDEGIQGHRKELANHNRAKAPLYSELKERNLPIHGDRVQEPHTDGKYGGSVLQPPVQSDAGEWPKVKLLPRTMPLESSEPPVIDRKRVKTNDDLHGNIHAAKPGIAGVESENQVVERRKLNLKPWSQPLELSEANSEGKRIALFGGARPREVVLKERGMEYTPISNPDFVQDSVRTKHNAFKIESAPEHAIPTCHRERADNLPLDQRIGKKSEKNDQRVETERVDNKRRNWRYENCRNNRDPERQQQLQQERHPSPETWRKPVDQPKAASDTIGVRYGKTASALELAQAFSNSFSDPKTADRYSSQRGLPGKTQVPFSRLMGPNPRTQINGY